LPFTWLGAASKIRFSAGRADGCLNRPAAGAMLKLCQCSVALSAVWLTTMLLPVTTGSCAPSKRALTPVSLW
jgi:hypothetical protein